METGTESNGHAEQAAPKKSKRRIYALIALAAAVVIYILVPSGAPANDDTTELSSDAASAETNIPVGMVKIESYEAKKRIIGKWVISGVLSNSSDAPIESIEFETVFSDNAEFVTYDEFIQAGETNHEFSIKVSGHKGENLNDLKIRSIQKAQ